ncbi:hypothetical protein ACH0AH_12770 [Microbacterium paludicola]
MAETQDKTESQSFIEETAGMRASFWSWMTIVAGGLAVMIAIPLMGR